VAKNKVDKNTWGLVLMDETSKLIVRRIRFEAQKRCTPAYLHGKEEREDFRS
jgi:hypothetical protein